MASNGNESQMEGKITSQGMAIELAARMGGDTSTVKNGKFFISMPALSSQQFLVTVKEVKASHWK